MEDSDGYGREGLAAFLMFIFGVAEQQNQPTIQHYYKETEFTAQYRLLYCHALHLSLLSSLPLQSTEKEILLQIFFCLCIKTSHRLDKSVWSCSLGWCGTVFLQCWFVSIDCLQSLCSCGADFYSAAAFHSAHLCLSELELSVWRMTVFSYVLTHQQCRSITNPFFLNNILLHWKKSRNLIRVISKLWTCIVYGKTYDIFRFPTHFY